jgi:hypothetical protein
MVETYNCTVVLPVGVTTVPQYYWSTVAPGVPSATRYQLCIYRTIVGALLEYPQSTTGILAT